jgi:hypothetical protein
MTVAWLQGELQVERRDVAEPQIDAAGMRNLLCSAVLAGNCRRGSI